MKRGLGAVAAVLAIGAFFAWKYFGADIQIELKQASGTAWNESRPEVKRKLTKVLSKQFAKLRLDARVVPRIVDCIVPKVLVRLNKTGCKYQYNSRTTTRAEHVRKQTACLKKVGYAETEERISRECIRAHFPDKWAVFEPVLVGSMAKSAPSHIARKKDWARCIVKRALAALRKTTCRPINRTGSKLMNTFDHCLKKEGLMKEIPAFTRGCAKR